MPLVRRTTTLGIFLLGTIVAVGCSSSSHVVSPPSTPESTAAPSSPTNAATTTTKAPAKGNNLSNPYPFGSTVAIPGGWNVKVVSVTPEANDPVAGAPPAGFTFMVVTLQLTRTGTDPMSAVSVIGSLVANNVERSVNSQPNCYGGTPDNNNVYQGGTTNTGDCISVPTSSVPTLVLSVTADFGFHITYFAVK
jgi:hypothetical protein